jgi:hypothetical protein
MYGFERFLKWLHGTNVSCLLRWFNWGKKVVSHFFPSSKLHIYFICMTRGRKNVFISSSWKVLAVNIKVCAWHSGGGFWSCYCLTQHWTEHLRYNLSYRCIHVVNVLLSVQLTSFYSVFWIVSDLSMPNDFFFSIYIYIYIQSLTWVINWPRLWAPVFTRWLWSNSIFCYMPCVSPINITCMCVGYCRSFVNGGNIMQYIMWRNQVCVALLAILLLSQRCTDFVMLFAIWL